MSSEPHGARKGTQRLMATSSFFGKKLSEHVGGQQNEFAPHIIKFPLS
ncbi:hypothetical protein N781_09340 [Pontibacillus halophilus JSM 076056 = DSM 19796]|uniref:Uncharacterized protein n=1 Tax=Pontibacillus halophilus JSM 076056 = DSM 19796 TaxID=1385510 RepID=A0A0A5GDM5_9BACI|nr:hypothetical protein N781_09340 [Pontibacillus halophilus JSM 076056 = DSM 19796]